MFDVLRRLTFRLTAKNYYLGGLLKRAFVEGENLFEKRFIVMAKLVSKNI